MFYIIPFYAFDTEYGDEPRFNVVHEENQRDVAIVMDVTQRVAESWADVLERGTI